MLTRSSVLLAAACLGGALLLPATASAQTAGRYTDGAAAPTANVNPVPANRAARLPVGPVRTTHAKRNVAPTAEPRVVMEPMVLLGVGF